MQPMVQLLYSCSRGNSNCRLQALALEGLALATDALGAQLSPLLRQVGASEVDISSILQQANTLQRPSLAADGLGVLHGSSVPAANTGDGSSFRISTYGSSIGRTYSGVTSSDARAAEASCDLSLTKLMALKTDSAAISRVTTPAAAGSQLGSINGYGSSSSRAGAPGASSELLQCTASKLLWDVPLMTQKGAAASQPQQQHQLQPQMWAVPAQQHLKPGFGSGSSTSYGDVAAGGACGIASAAARGGLQPDRYASAVGHATDSRESSLHSSFTSSSQQQHAGPSGYSSSSCSSSNNASLVQASSSLMVGAPGVPGNALAGEGTRLAAV